MDKLKPRKLERKIRKEGNKEEIETLKLGKNSLKLLNKLSPGEEYQGMWNSFDALKNAFKANVQRYKGIYSGYFGNMLKEIDEQERQALGYHLH